jgi:hypothetical protein
LSVGWYRIIAPAPPRLSLSVIERLNIPIIPAITFPGAPFC